MSESVTAVLAQVAEGDSAAKDELWRLVYADLKSRARRALYRRYASWRPTELVQEVFLKFEAQRNTPVSGAHFRAIAARLMYRVLLDHLDRHGRRERPLVTLQTHQAVESALDVDALALRQALKRLEETEPRLATIVVLRFFGELTMAEIASELELTERQVYRLWRFARARLLSDIEGSGLP